MSIKGTEYMGDLGKKIPTRDDQHITQTNDTARDGEGAHVTDNITGTPYKVHTWFDASGNYRKSDFGKR